MQEVMSVSDRVVVMDEGKVTGILDRNDLSQEAIMQMAIQENAAKEDIDER